MIVDRYEPVNLFELLPKQLQLEMDPVLAKLDRLLDDDVLFAWVKEDLAKRHPKSRTHGRHSTPVEVILRMLIVRRLYDLSYEKTERFVSDSLTLRQFCRLYLERTPDDTTLIRWSNLIGEQTLRRIHERVVALAREHKVSGGRKLRIDGTVVETNIAHPTDSGLLRDGVRVLGRLARKAKRCLAQEARAVGGLFGTVLAAPSAWPERSTKPAGGARRKPRGSWPLTSAWWRWPRRASGRPTNSEKRCWR